MQKLHPDYLNSLAKQLDTIGEVVIIFKNEYIQVIKDETIEGDDLFRYFCYVDLGIPLIDCGEVALLSSQEAIKYIIAKIDI